MLTECVLLKPRSSITVGFSLKKFKQCSDVVYQSNEPIHTDEICALLSRGTVLVDRSFRLEGANKWSI